MVERRNDINALEEYVSHNASDWLEFASQDRHSGLMLIYGTIKATRCLAISFIPGTHRVIDASAGAHVLKVFGGQFAFKFEKHPSGDGVFHRYAPPESAKLEAAEWISTTDVNPRKMCLFVQYIKVKANPKMMKRIQRFFRLLTPKRFGSRQQEGTIPQSNSTSRNPDTMQKSSERGPTSRTENVDSSADDEVVSVLCCGDSYTRDTQAHAPMFLG